MKRFLLATFVAVGGLILAGFACGSGKPKYEHNSSVSIELGQRVFLCDSTLNVRDMQITAARDSVLMYRRKSDTLRTNLFIARYKVERVKYYVAICDKKPTNKKFFFGWIKNRALGSD